MKSAMVSFARLPRVFFSVGVAGLLSLMNCYVRSFTFMALAAFAGFGQSAAEADVVLSTPAGVSPGGSFRFIYATPTTTIATSTSIATYNTFVSNATNTGSATYEGVLVSWSAVASVSGVNAKDNVGIYNVPVYLANGNRVVASDAKLWDSSLLEAQLDRTLSDGFPANDDIWTGSQTSGTGWSGQLLGASRPRSGRDDFVNGNWVDRTRQAANTILLSMYGISNVLVAPVPEPSTVAMALAGLACGGYSLFRRRRAR